MRTFFCVVGLAAWLAGCGGEVQEGNEAPGGAGGSSGAGASGGSGGSGGSKASGGASGAASVARAAVEVRLSPPASSIPNIGTRTSCTAGTTGTYTYFLGALSQGPTGEARVGAACWSPGRA